MPQQTIAIVGASADRRKYGNRAVRTYLRQGWDVYPVNPHAERIEGLPVYRSVSEIPAPQLDRISLYVPPSIGMQLLDDFARRPPGELWLNPGAESPELIARAEQLGLNVVSACSIVDIGESP